MQTLAAQFLGEFFGTAILCLFGGGVCAGVGLNRSKSNAAGWVAIAFGWGFGVLSGAYFSTPLSGGHINPAVTIGLASSGTFEWSLVPVYIPAQVLGGMFGAFLVWLTYFGQFTSTPGPYLSVFSTEPEIRKTWQNLTTEIIATFSLVFVIVATGAYKELQASGMGVLIVALLVVGIGLSLGGPTGYAINPARDLGPRIMHQLLPIRGKGSSDWAYSWIPIVGPIIGGAIGGGLGGAMYNNLPLMTG